MSIIKKSYQQFELDAVYQEGFEDGKMCGHEEMIEALEGKLKEIQEAGIIWPTTANSIVISWVIRFLKEKAGEIDPAKKELEEIFGR